MTNQSQVIKTQTFDFNVDSIYLSIILFPWLVMYINESMFCCLMFTSKVYRHNRNALPWHLHWHTWYDIYICISLIPVCLYKIKASSFIIVRLSLYTKAVTKASALFSIAFFSRNDSRYISLLPRRIILLYILFWVARVSHLEK